MNELILINKPSGCTSRDVVNIVSKELNTKKVGHFGTLDPLASGLLLIGVNKYTKLGNFLKEDTKEYIATVLIGTSTDTYDIDGKVLKEIKNINITKEEIEKVLKTFNKTYLQEVPSYSAVKKYGKKLYEYARKGIEIELPKKEVTIYNIELLDMYEKNNNKYFRFKTLVSKGTYIRSLINDLSKELNIPLCMSALIRTKQDKFSLEEANTIEDIKNKTYKSLNIRDILDLEVLSIPKELEKKVLNGSKIEKLSDKMILFTKNNEDIVLYEPVSNEMKPVLTLKNN